jgi:hypothetical protein
MADVFTQAGEELVTDDFEAARTWYVGWGTGAGTAAKGDTALFTEAAEARIVAVMTQPAADQNQGVATIVSASGQTITNGGLLSALSGGTLSVHGDHAGILLAVGDKIEYTIQLQWA